MNDGSESGQINCPDSGCQHCCDQAVVKNDLAQHGSKLGQLKEISWAASGVYPRLRLRMNQAPESSQITWPDSGCQHCCHWNQKWLSPASAQTWYAEKNKLGCTWLPDLAETQDKQCLRIGANKLSWFRLLTLPSLWRYSCLLLQSGGALADVYHRQYTN